MCTQCPCLRMKLIVRILVLFIPHLRISNGFSSIKKLENHVLNQMKEAIAVTSAAQTNITKAYEACDLWKDVLSSSELPINIWTLCSAFYASSLARIGKDTSALEIFDSVIQNKEELNEQTMEDVVLGRAHVLQRLMKYKEAKEQFLKSTSSKATVGAVTCLFRLGDLNQADHILNERLSSYQEVDGHLLDLLLGTKTIKLESCLGILQDSTCSTPLARWIASSSEKSYQRTTSLDTLELSDINQTPFDDPLLIHLDDKIKLQQLMRSNSSTASTCWPLGFILPDEAALLKDESCGEQGRSWILKTATGYGSHGNRIVTKLEALDVAALDSSNYLCQKMISPSLLINGRKFSMRVYVYYFADGDVYLSKLGLVKFASEKFVQDSDQIDNRMYMTNSGRDDFMLQDDFVFLKHYFQKEGFDFPVFWSRIKVAVKSVMGRFNTLREKNPLNYREGLVLLGIPKILGFDFMVTPEFHPKLLEVNRFPGLEPRGKFDEAVKASVVQEAWVCASHKRGTAGLLTDKKSSMRTSHEQVI